MPNRDHFILQGVLSKNFICLRKPNQGTLSFIHLKDLTILSFIIVERGKDCTVISGISLVVPEYPSFIIPEFSCLSLVDLFHKWFETDLSLVVTFALSASREDWFQNLDYKLCKITVHNTVHSIKPYFQPIWTLFQKRTSYFRLTENCWYTNLCTLYVYCVFSVLNLEQST